jgi:outer membrane protein OmpA-like peptidoglycan-associated protein
MHTARCATRAGTASVAPLLAVLVLNPATGARAEPPPTVVDSQSIVRGLTAPAAATRGFEVAPRVTAGGASGGASGSASPGASHKINLDIRFASDSDRLTSAATAQLAQLGSALTSPQLAHSRFLIAGHTSATGSSQHNQRLSVARAQSVRSYLIEHFNIAADRIEATGYGSSRPLPDFPPGALQQRRVEISTLPPAS